jgi:hypothetical protein
MFVKAQNPRKMIAPALILLFEGDVQHNFVRLLSDNITTSEALTGLQQRPILVFRQKLHPEGTECA